MDTLDSAITKSAGTGNAGCLELDLELQIRIIEDLSSEKFKVQRSQPMTEGKGCFIDRRLAKCLYIAVAAFPIPPDVTRC